MDIVFRIIKPIKEAGQFVLGLITNENVYNKEDIDLAFDKKIFGLLDELNDELFILIEYPYVDKVYRDSYYSYFSSKHQKYFRDCIRLSFFNEKIIENDFRNIERFKFLQDKFLGYVIIRPTFPSIIGRSLLKKEVFAKSDFVSCNYVGNVLVNGVKLVVQGFPHCSQDSETITCAETTIWSLMEYFGNRYPEYKPTLPSKIIEVLNKYSDQRLLPSNGLTINQISFALKDFGFGTHIYSREAYDKELEEIISIYVESGIPIIARVDNDKISHAILIIGHEKDGKNIKVNKGNRLKIRFVEENYNCIDYSKIERKYLVQDDNLLPYRLINLNDPFEHYNNEEEDNESDFKWGQINSIVAPLYPKIYLEAVKARKLAINILADSGFGHKFSSNFIFRFYLASSRSFKFHIASIREMKNKQKNYIVDMPMPKFIWCAEIYEPGDFRKNVASGLIILDATEASENEQDALLFAGYPSQIILKSGSGFAYSTEKLEFYNKYNNNLS